MRMQQFKLPKAEGDPEDARAGPVLLPRRRGSVQDNLRGRRRSSRSPRARKPEEAIKAEKIKLGGMRRGLPGHTGHVPEEAAPFDPNAKVTKMTGYRQLYVIFEAKEGQYYMTLARPGEDDREAQEGVRGVGEELQVISGQETGNRGLKPQRSVSCLLSPVPDHALLRLPPARAPDRTAPGGPAR